MHVMSKLVVLCVDLQYEWSGARPLKVEENNLGQYRLVSLTSGHRYTATRSGTRSVLYIQIKLERTLGYYFIRY